MTDDRPSPSLGDILGDLPPLPDSVWERTLATAFDPDVAVDADLVPEMTDVPVVPEDDEIELAELLLDDPLLDDPLLDDGADHLDHSSVTQHAADRAHAAEHHHLEDEPEVDLGTDMDPLDGQEPSETLDHHVDHDGPDLDPGLGDDVS
jgi:hypothetical protein